MSADFKLTNRPTTNLDQENINALAEALAESVSSLLDKLLADCQDHPRTTSTGEFPVDCDYAR